MIAMNFMLVHDADGSRNGMPHALVKVVVICCE